MIINTGMRTDIPAFYSDWFIDKIKKAKVCVRNPYNPHQITQYTLDPKVVDCLIFCSKNPAPLIRKIEKLKDYKQLWHVTVTPYGRDIEPLVPYYQDVLNQIKDLNNFIPTFNISWRYDPIFLSEYYTEEYHYDAFNHFAQQLNGYAHHAIISYINLYQNTIRNHNHPLEVPFETKLRMTKQLSQIAKANNLNLIVCGGEKELQAFSSEQKICIDQRYLEKIIGDNIKIPHNYKGVRDDCACILGHDLGTYNTCIHGCTYCYANFDHKLARANFRTHNPESLLLFGDIRPQDHVSVAKQSSWIDRQLSLF